MKGPYSNEFKDIVEKMLDKDPTKRPSADELWTEILPTVSLFLPLSVKFIVHWLIDIITVMRYMYQSIGHVNIRIALLFIGNSK